MRKRLDNTWGRTSDSQFFFHDLNSSTQITCWAYEQAENAKAHVWVLNDETRPIGTYWRNLCWQESTEALMAADKNNAE